MFFRSFESLEREAIKEQLELSLKSHTSTIVFVF